MTLRRGLLGFFVLGALLLLIPTLRQLVDFPVFYLVFATFLCFWIAQATSWNVLSGYSGYFSFGQAAFFGTGVYTSAVLAVRFDWNFFLTIPVAGASSAVLGALVGALAFRLSKLRGEIFALLTLAVSFILASVVRISSTLGGGQGLTVTIPEYPAFLGEFPDLIFRMSVAVAVGALATAFAVQHSRLGMGLFAIRDAEDVAEGLGVPTFRHKMVALVVSGFIAGTAGSIFALQVGFITVGQVFGLTVPLFVIVMSVLGGRLHWAGPLIGASLVYTLQDRLAGSGFEGWSRIALGLVLAALVLLAPQGLLDRYRARLRASLGVFIAVLAGLALARWVGGPIDWLAIAMLASAVVALLPGARRAAAVRRPSPRRAEEARPAAPVATRGPGHPATNGPPLLECRGVTKRFGGLHALHGVSLQVLGGEVVALVGPNGSGKSTLINVVSGSVPTTSGEVWLNGHRVDVIEPHHRAHLGLARSYQIPAPFEAMTVRDNVAVALVFGRDALSLERAREVAEGHLELVGLAGVADAFPSQINLHQRRMLEMARALATGPRLLLLDEVLAGLNPVEIERALSVVREIHGSGVTIVIVEHLIRVVTGLATRVVVLDEGRILAQGDPSEVMEDPAVVRAYLGETQRA
ncbi:MAG: ABC transporter permease subunit [Actinomycetota bacterium]